MYEKDKYIKLIDADDYSYLKTWMHISTSSPFINAKGICEGKIWKSQVEVVFLECLPTSQSLHKILKKCLTAIRPCAFKPSNFHSMRMLNLLPYELCFPFIFEM